MYVVIGTIIAIAIANQAVKFIDYPPVLSLILFQNKFTKKFRPVKIWFFCSN